MPENPIPAKLSDYLFSISQVRILRDDLRNKEYPCKCRQYPGDNYWCSQHGIGHD